MESPTLWYWLLPLIFTLLAAAYFFWRVGRDASAKVKKAQTLFEQHRPELQSAFFQAAAISGKPRGLRWKECQWEPLIEWMRDKKTEQLIALVGVTISFEAIEGGDMEGLAAVGNLRNATAVFFHQDGHWLTAGRVIFNLNPNEAVTHFGADYEHVIVS